MKLMKSLWRIRDAMLQSGSRWGSGPLLMGTLWSQFLTCAMQCQAPPVGNCPVLPRICKGWSAAQLNSCKSSGKKLPVLQMQFRCIGEAVISQLAGLYLFQGNLNIQSLEIKSFFFFFFKHPIYLVSMFSWCKGITWKLSGSVLNRLI